MINSYYFVAAGLMLCSTGATAQASLPQPANRAEFVDFLKSGDPLRRAGTHSAATKILMGEKTQPGVSPDLLAEDLVAFSVSGAPWKDRATALSAITFAGHPDRPKRYARAAQSLAEVLRRSDDPAARSVAIAGIVQVGSPEFAFATLKTLATTPHPKVPSEQYAAINLIAKMDTEASAAFLRALDKSGTVKDQRARGALGEAATNGYRKRPPG